VWVSLSSKWLKNCLSNSLPFKVQILFYFIEIQKQNKYFFLLNKFLFVLLKLQLLKSEPTNELHEIHFSISTLDIFNIF
jgi:hypothetical protein